MRFTAVVFVEACGCCGDHFQLAWSVVFLVTGPVIITETASYSEGL